MSTIHVNDFFKKTFHSRNSIYFCHVLLRSFFLTLYSVPLLIFSTNFSKHLLFAKFQSHKKVKHNFFFRFLQLSFFIAPLCLFIFFSTNLWSFQHVNVITFIPTIDHWSQLTTIKSLWQFFFFLTFSRTKLRSSISPLITHSFTKERTCWISIFYNTINIFSKKHLFFLSKTPFSIFST